MHTFTLKLSSKDQYLGYFFSMGRKNTRFDENKTIESLEIRKKVGKDHNDISKYKYFKVDIPYPEKFSKFTNDEDNHYLYRCIYEVWCQGFEDGSLNQN